MSIRRSKSSRNTPALLSWRSSVRLLMFCASLRSLSTCEQHRLLKTELVAMSQTYMSTPSMHIRCSLPSCIFESGHRLLLPAPLLPQQLQY